MGHFLQVGINPHDKTIGKKLYTQLTFTCSKSTRGTPEKGAKYVQS